MPDPLMRYFGSRPDPRLSLLADALYAPKPVSAGPEPGDELPVARGFVVPGDPFVHFAAAALNGMPAAPIQLGVSFRPDATWPGMQNTPLAATHLLQTQSGLPSAEHGVLADIPPGPSVGDGPWVDPGVPFDKPPSSWSDLEFLGDGTVAQRSITSRPGIQIIIPMCDRFEARSLSRAYASWKLCGKEVERFTSDPASPPDPFGVTGGRGAGSGSNGGGNGRLWVYQHMAEFDQNLEDLKQGAEADGQLESLTIHVTFYEFLCCDGVLKGLFEWSAAWIWKWDCNDPGKSPLKSSETWGPGKKGPNSANMNHINDFLKVNWIDWCK